jgi:hypothetical protein
MGEELLFEAERVSLRRFDTGRYSLKRDEFQLIFTSVSRATGYHSFSHEGTIIGTLPRVKQPHELTVKLDELSEDT